MNKRASVREIGRVAGVSHATVSYVLSGNGDAKAISKPTQERIRRVAEQLGWQPNYMLSALASGKTRLVGLWLFSLGDPYHAWVMETMEQRLCEDGYAALISPARAKSADGMFDLDLFNRWSADGLIALDGGHLLRRFLETKPRWHLPTVNMGWYVLSDHPRVDSVHVDVLSPTRTALERWADEGRRRIAMLSRKFLDFDEMDPREKVYRDFVRSRNLDLELISFPAKESFRLGAEKALRRHIKKQGCPDAIFCQKDEVLMGAYKTLQGLGCSIPDQVALLGNGVIQEAEYLDHPVSMVVQPVEAMCRAAWDLLQTRLARPDRAARHETLTATLQWHTEK